jgi:hypothetical protein
MSFQQRPIQAILTPKVAFLFAPLFFSIGWFSSFLLSPSLSSFFSLFSLLRPPPYPFLPFVPFIDRAQASA